MNEVFHNDEQLYRAVFPPKKMPHFWKNDGSLSDAALRDKKGLSVERGNYREDSEVVKSMAKYFSGMLFSLCVEDCIQENAVLKYLPTERSIYHTEIHGSDSNPLLSSSQRKHLIEKIRVVDNLEI